MLWLLCSLGGMYLDKLANGENEKYMYGKNVYSEEEVREYFYSHFTKDEIEVLNVLTEHYCNIISMDMTHMGEKKSLPYLRFILRSCNFGITQQLVYMPDGSNYRDDAGRIIELGDNWYYHTNR